MISHFIKLGLRNLYKNKSNTCINVISFALGIAILLVIAIFANNELSIDTFHKKSSRIYKVSYGDISVLPGPLAALLNDNFPEVQHATHIETRQLFARSPILNYNDEPIEITSYYSADPAFFNVFDFQVLRGDALPLVPDGQPQILAGNASVGGGRCHALHGEIDVDLSPTRRRMGRVHHEVRHGLLHLL